MSLRTCGAPAPDNQLTCERAVKNRQNGNRPKPGGAGVFMPLDPIEQPFDSIESAYDFMSLLAQTILDNVKDLRRDFEIATHEGQERRARAIELAIFKCRALNCHVHRSRRTLNDLRTIRRLILNERMTPDAVLSRAQGE